MMRFRRILVHALLVSAIVLSVCLASCNGSNGSTTIPESTKVLDETTLNYLSGASVNSSTLVFENTTDQLSSLSVGDVIVSGVSEATPYGLLRKVTNIVADGNQMTVETVAATLEDAIQDCTIDTNWRLQSDGNFAPLGSNEAINALGESVEALATGFYLQLDDVVLYDNDGNLDTRGDQITADLSVNLNIDVDIGWTISWFRMTEAHFQSTISVTSEVETSCTVAVLEIHPKLEVYRQYLAPFTVMVGPVPVVILPMLSINIGLDGEVSAGITAGVTANAELTAGVQYADENWSPIASFSTSFDWQEPSLTAGCKVKVFAGPQLSLLLYGEAGPYIEVRGYLELDADIFRTPWWELYGGLEADVGFKVEAMGHEIADYEKPLAIGYRVLLAYAETPTPVTFPDPNLETAIREAIGKPMGDIYPSDLAGLTHLDASERDIVDITGLEYCTELTELNLYHNQISDISPLTNLAKLSRLSLGSNQISDISPLASLTNLRDLFLYNNQISDISPLANLTNLWALSLAINQISNISPLANLTNLWWLHLQGNQISDISPLADLTSLELLYLDSNKISNISALASLVSLADLDLWYNQIVDISPLLDNPGLGEGDYVGLGNNPLSEQSTNEYIPELEARGVTVDY